MASYLQARANSGTWILRIEDIDPPREQVGATELIIKALERYGFEWDGPTSFQSENRAGHDAALELLIAQQHAYRCGCSRRDLSGANVGPLGSIYPGTCRQGCDATEYAFRVRTDDNPIIFVDGLQGEQKQSIESESGDFIIKRRDGLIAYQLAVAVDDSAQKITEVVRGIDLLDSTPRQIWLQRLLAYSTPRYLHIPVATFPNGQKLSKNTGAPGIPLDHVNSTLLAALSALHQHPDKSLQRASLAEIWAWARHHWRPTVLAGKTSIPVDSSGMPVAG